MGRAFVYREQEPAVASPHEIKKHQVADELARVENAMEAVRKHLKTSSRRIEADANAKLAKIFEAHEVMLGDPALRKEIAGLVEEELVDGAQALERVFSRWERKLRAQEDENQRNAADDVADLKQRSLRELTGVKATPLEKIPNGIVLVARRLLPSDTVALPRRAVAGIVVDFAGQGSHVALLAEALGIPTVGGIRDVTDRIDEGSTLIVDGFRGEVVLNPDPAARKRCQAEIQACRSKSVRKQQSARETARTQDGTTISVLANVGGREDVSAAGDNGADGVGLYRIEQHYLSLKTPPSKADLVTHLRETFAPLSQKPITIRLLDLGGDKPLPFLRLPAEEDPFLGRRGVRLLLHYPDLLDTQLEALLEFSQDHDVRILIPMVTVADDVVAVRKRLTHVAEQVKHKTLPPLGAMVETPAAALSVGELANHADFLSIGTNDLTQYTMAAGRENPLVNDYFIEDHPAVMRLVGMVAQEAGTTPVGICGELARQIAAVPRLLQLGIRTLSVAPPLVPDVKEAIREILLERAQ
jgi:phosphotransferase system enzyme I (PtsI)